MATRKTTKKTAKKTAKKTSKRTPAKKPAGKAGKNPSVKKTVKAKPKPKKDTCPEFHIFDLSGKTFVPAEKAKPVKLEGLEEFRLFLHRALETGDWAISEATSGGRVAYGRTQKEAKEQATTAILREVGKEKTLEAIKRSIETNGPAPGFEDAAKATGKHTAKKTFSVTTDDGTEVEVTFDREFRNHLEFRGEISPTGYRSHFGYDGTGKVKDAARKIANDLRAEFLKEQAKASRKGRKKTKGDPVAPVIKAGGATLKGRIVAELCAQHKLGNPQVHESDLIKTADRPAPDVTATLMILELEGRIKSLPGKFYRMAKRDAGKPSGNRGRKPNGQLSQLDAAVKILTDAKGPLTCKEICRRMLERKLWESSGRTPGATLSASMQREIAKRGSEARFRRAERGLYELNA
jgi:hypothetical protein